MATGEFQDHFNSRLDRIEDKLDKYTDRISVEISSLSGRLQPLERDVAVAKKALAVSMGGIIAVGWDAIKRKIGMS